ncbi:MAG TPA: serine hydrolase [Blastocatellia bacterium]|nr:serine hydrolase [Blastocatellia bacterium]
MKRFLTIIALALSVATPAMPGAASAAAQVKDASAAARPSADGLAEKSAKVDEIMSAMIRPGAPGAAVMVIRDGKVIHKKGYGLANVEAGTPIDTNTVFDLASVSKQFTAMAVMILAERGKLSYDDPLTKFFPEFPAYASKITVRHLLNHTSGLPDYMASFEKLGKKDFEPTSKDAIKMLSEMPEPRFAPGDKWEYSNSGYMVLAQIVEKASGMGFASFMKKNIFDPLGMNNTLIADESRPKIADRAISYAPQAEGFKNIDYTPLNLIFGDGNVNTSVEDMYRWDQALYTEKLVKQATLKQAFTPAKLNDGSPTKYGFGWSIGDVNGLQVLAHGGAWVGFRTYIIRFPGERFTVIVLSNFARFNPEAVSKRIARVYLEEKLPGKVSVKVDPKKLSAYAGKYELRPGFVLEVTLENDTLWVKATGQPKLRLGAESETKFFVQDSEDIGITFNKDESGNVPSLTLHQGGNRLAKRVAG